MTSLKRIAVLFLFALAVGVPQFLASPALAQSTYFTSRGCVNCHAAPTVATCNGCHHHGNSNLKAATDKTSYTPGETVTATLSGGSRTGWIRAVLYDQNNAEIAISNGNASGMGSSTTFPAALTAPAPSTPGTYTWRMAYFGNLDGTGSGDVHGEKTVNTNSFTVAALPVPAPSITSVTPGSLVQGASNQTVTIAGANLTGAAVSFSNAGITGGAATVTPTSVTLPVSVSAGAAVGAGTVTVTTANGAASGAFSVTATPASAPTLTLSMLADGAYTNNVTLNVSGTASDPQGIKSVTVNGAPVSVNPDGSFSTALTLAVGSNTVTVVATDNADTGTTATRTITYDSTAPVLAVTDPADNSTTTESFLTVTGTINETSTVTVSDTSGNPQTAAINGNSFTATVNLVSGLNTIAITATDLAGNSADAKRTVTYTPGALSLTVTAPPQDITTNQAMFAIQGSVTDALTPVTVTITVDGQTYTPQVTNGVFTQPITFTTPKTYAVTVTARDEAGNQTAVQRNIIYAQSARGDLDGDGMLTIADALMSLRIAVGVIPMDNTYLAAGDVTPYVGGMSKPDGKIDITDALLLLKMCVGLVTL